MKILYLSSNLSNEAGGYAESSFLLREKLDKFKNNDAYLFGFWKSKYFRLNYILSDKINIFPAGLIKIYPFSFSYLKKMFLIAPNLIDVQGLWSSSAIFNLIYNKLRPTPYVVTPRGMLEEWALNQSYFKKLIYYFLIEKYHLKNATCLRATSDMEMNTFKKLGFKNKIINIPNSIKIPKVNLKIKFKIKKKKRILFLSRIHEKKGISELLNAWKYIHNKYLDLHFPDYYLDEVDGNILEEFVKKLKNAGTPHKTSERILQHIHTFLRWCLYRKFINKEF